MKCAVGCVSPAVGIANLSSTKDDYKGVYPLCNYHYTEVINGRWVVRLEGWEELPSVKSEVSSNECGD